MLLHLEQCSHRFHSVPQILQTQVLIGATLATSRIMTDAEQRKYWRTARNIYARSLEIWREMETRGILTGEYAAEPREVAREIARCDSFLRN